MLQSVREATIKETITVCGWNLNWGCNGANIEMELKEKRIQLFELATAYVFKIFISPASFLLQNQEVKNHRVFEVNE